ncbi:MAG: hypothetical protein ACLUHE_04550 [Christensenellales bacterium]
MGSPLLPMDDVPLACRLLQTMGAQRVLVVAPQTALRHQPDALEQASGFLLPCAREMGKRRRFPHSSAGEVRRAVAFRFAVWRGRGREAAAQGMEAALMRLGMPLCRVLPFRRKLTAP